MKTPTKPRSNATGFIIGFLLCFSLCSGYALNLILSGRFVSSQQVVMQESEVDAFYSKLMETR